MTGAMCGTCGTAALRENAKFCDECGAPIAQAHKVTEFQLGLAQPLRIRSHRISIE
jgi:predicted amidophosphoribosyltransferase